MSRTKFELRIQPKDGSKHMYASIPYEGIVPLRPDDYVDTEVATFMVHSVCFNPIRGVYSILLRSELPDDAKAAQMLCDALEKLAWDIS